MLFNGSPIPNFIDGFIIILAEINSLRMETISMAFIVCIDI